MGLLVPLPALAMRLMLLIGGHGVLEPAVKRGVEWEVVGVGHSVQDVTGGGAILEDR